MDPIHLDPELSGESAVDTAPPVPGSTPAPGAVDVAPPVPGSTPGAPDAAPTPDPIPPSVPEEPPLAPEEPEGPEEPPLAPEEPEGPEDAPLPTVSEFRALQAKVKDLEEHLVELVGHLAQSFGDVYKQKKDRMGV